MKTFDIALHKKKVYDLVVGRCPAVSRIDIHSLPVRLMTSAASRMIFTQTLTGCLLRLSTRFSSQVALWAAAPSAYLCKSERAVSTVKISVLIHEATKKKSGLAPCGVLFSQRANCIIGRYRALSDISGLNLPGIDHMTLKEFDYITEQEV